MNAVTGDELKSFVERIERLDQEKREAMDLQKEVYVELKGRGYDAKIVKLIVALRKRDSDDVAQEESLLEMYKEAIGME